MIRNTYLILKTERLEAEVTSLKRFMQLKDQEIERQIRAKRLAQQTRNWVIILTALIHLGLWLF